MSASARFFGKLAKALGPLGTSAKGELKGLPVNGIQSPFAGGLRAVKGEGTGPMFERIEFLSAGNLRPMSCTAAEGGPVQLPPIGFVLTPSGLLVPYNKVDESIVDLKLHMMDTVVVQRSEKGASLFIRMTRVVIYSVGCYLALKAAWLEATNRGKFKDFYPTTDAEESNGSLTYLEIKALVDDASKVKIQEFYRKIEGVCKKEELFMIVDEVTDEHTQMLLEKGLTKPHLHIAQLLFMRQLRNCLFELLARMAEDKRLEELNQQKSDGTEKSDGMERPESSKPGGEGSQ